MDYINFAFTLHNNKPFTDIQKPIQPWTWYTERFVETTQKPPAEFIYNWAQSALKLYVPIL